jgi:hypothetical protein
MMAWFFGDCNEQILGFLMLWSGGEIVLMALKNGFVFVSPPMRSCLLLCHGAAARYFFLAAKVPKSALDFLF